MSYSLLGFVEVANFRNNGVGQTSPIGEMTKDNYTYSNEVERYQLVAYPNVDLVSLDSRRNGDLVDVGLVYRDLVLKISEWMYSRSITGSISNDKGILLQALRAEFGDVATFTDIGDIYHKDSYRLPSHLTLNATASGETNEITVWYAHEVLTALYPGNEQESILPVDNIDDLAGDREAALTLLRAITILSHGKRVETAIKGFPQTYLMTHNFDWVDPDNPDITSPAPFSANIHGPAGKNMDYIKERYRNAILASSKHDASFWAKRFPTLFTQTEFYVIPNWDRIALPNLGSTAGIYSSTMRHSDALLYANKYCKGYLAAHIAANLCTSGSSYQALLFVSCGNPDNYGATSAFDTQWPGYTSTDTKAPDFGQMPPKIQVLSLQLSTLFKAAEVATETSLVPGELTRVLRDGVYYLTTTVDNVQLLCPIKKGFSKGA